MTWDASSGSYLSSRPPGAADAWTEATARAGRSGTQQIREVTEAVPPPEVAAALRLAADQAAIVRRRTVFLDSKPIELVDSWYPASIASATPLAQPQKIKGGAVTLLASLGYPALKALDDVSVRGATDAEAELLGLSVGAPVIVVFRTTTSEGDVPFEVTVMIMVPDDRHLRYPLSVG
jgi:GntR family transcriptional regulator